MPDYACCGSGMKETAGHAFYYCERVRSFWDHVEEWTARIEPKLLVLLDVGYVIDSVFPPFQGEKCVVFLTILAVARMVIWTTQKKGLYDDANFSHRDLVLYFRHQLSWGACGVVIIVVGNGHGDTSSNPGRDWLHFHSTNTLGEGMNPIILPPAMGK